MTELRTARLLLRPWRDEDLPAFAALNADPEVRRWFPGVQTRAESDASAGRMRRHIEEHGFGFWAVETAESPFIGMAGLVHVPFAAPFAPCVEIGWRLARAHWGRGYATEAARAALEHGFAGLGLAEIVAFTVPGNTRSRRVMERIGMTEDVGGGFDHSGVPEGSPMRRHVLYRVGPEAARLSARTASRAAAGS